MAPVEEFVQAFIALFVIMDPFGSLPIFWQFTKKLPDEKRMHMAKRTLLTAAIVQVIFLFFGLRILSLFSITLDSFKVAGGIVLLILGIRLVISYHPLEARIRNYNDTIVPIAVPLLVGPGVITTTILLTGMYGYAFTLLVALAVLLVTLLAFYYVRQFMAFFGQQGSDVISRIIGIFIIAIAVTFIKEGWALL